MRAQKVTIPVVKTVLDTNVFISAILFKSEANKLVALWQCNKIIFLISKEVLEEYIKVLSYPKFRLTNEEVKYIIEEELLPFVKPIKTKSKFNIIVNDPSDNKFISLAVDGNAAYIISGDNHLREIKEFQKIKIITIKKFLSIIQT